MRECESKALVFLIVTYIAVLLSPNNVAICKLHHQSFKYLLHQIPTRSTFQKDHYANPVIHTLYPMGKGQNQRLRDQVGD